MQWHKVSHFNVQCRRECFINYLIPRVDNIGREGERLTAYTCFKHTASSTKSTLPGVNYISAHIIKESLYLIKHNCVFYIIDINVLAYCRWTIELWTSSALCFSIRCFLFLLKRLSLAANSCFGILASHIAWNSSCGRQL